MDALRHALKVVSSVPEYPAGQSGSAQAVHAAACQLGKLDMRISSAPQWQPQRGSICGCCEALQAAPVLLHNNLV